MREAFYVVTYILLNLPDMLTRTLTSHLHNIRACLLFIFFFMLAAVACYYIFNLAVALILLSGALFFSTMLIRELDRA